MASWNNNHVFYFRSSLFAHHHHRHRAISPFSFSTCRPPKPSSPTRDAPACTFIKADYKHDRIWKPELLRPGDGGCKCRECIRWALFLSMWNATPHFTSGHSCCGTGGRWESWEQGSGERMGSPNSRLRTVKPLHSYLLCGLLVIQMATFVPIQ